MIPETALVPHRAGPVATVYLVVPPAGGRTAAVKVYPEAVDRPTLAEFADEQDRLARLRTVSSMLLVELIDELPDGRTGLRMEFCPQSLTELTAAGPLPIGEVVELGATLAAVLADAHAAGIVHGGVTPANVLQRSTGQPVLSDFGLGLRQRFSREVGGEAAYLAPEVLRGGEPDAAADVYGLGAVLHLALTARSPFPARPGEAPGDVVLRVLREPAADVSGTDVPPGLTGLLARMLAKEPTERPDAAAVVSELAALGSAPEPAAADELNFDDFRDELAAGRSTAVLAPQPQPQPWEQPQPQSLVRPATKVATKRRPSRNTVLGIAAAISVIAVLPVLLNPGDDSESLPVPQVPTVAPSVTPTPQPTPPPAVQLQLDPPIDRGTYVVLRWRSSKPLTYAVFAAQQGGKAPRTSYRGAGTTLTVPVSPGLKYCFLVQGTDGANNYESAPKPIRGATCKS